MTKKQHIVEVATCLFNQYGYHVVGVDLIIKEACVSKKTMYKYFHSKSNLIIEVLKQRQEMCGFSLNEKLKDETNAFKKLELLFNWHDEWFNTTTFTGCLFAKAATEFPDKATGANQIASQQKQGLMQLIEHILLDIVPYSAKKIAPIIIMLLDGATLSAQVLGDKNAAQTAWKTTSHLIKVHLKIE